MQMEDKKPEGEEQKPDAVAREPLKVEIPALPAGPPHPWELTDEIMNTLKTSFPLLNLTMEKMVDQIQVRAKPGSDEDIYRFFAALLADALQVCLIAKNVLIIAAVGCS